MRRVHALDGLRVRHDHPPRQRRVLVLEDRRHQPTPPRVREDVRPLLQVSVFQHVPYVATRRVEGLDCNGVNERAARRVLLLAGVVEGEPHGAVLGLEGPGVRVPAAAGIHGLDGEHAELRCDGHVQPLLLGAGARRAESDGVVRAPRHAKLLPDSGVIAQPHGARALRHRHDHVLLIVAGLDVLHEPRDLPVRYGVAPRHHRAVQLGLVRSVLEVAIW
uniref:Uncharacterized protein n=1 Tax=Oryza brachyantha TaxID=4533 RepID=J3LZ73_ORYBR